MKSYQRFIFESFELTPGDRTIHLRYSLDENVHFEEKFVLPQNIPFDPTHPDLQKALFALHLSGGATYYKTYCPKEIEIRSGALTPDEAQFWNALYTHGLGEFFYQNQLDFRGLINFPVGAKPAPAKPAPAHHTPKHALVPYGGGKDSTVSSEILRAAGVSQTLFRVNSHHIITELAGIADLPLTEIRREIDPGFFEFQEGAGAYKGHVPITGHLSFLAIAVSLLAGYDSVFFSNERSSSYGNVEYLGMQVNHQWSKSQEFEVMLRRYIEQSITSGVQYLNAIRPLSELHIAKLFSGYTQYLPAATSCNRNWTLAGKSGDAPRWCGACPKCAFSFALLSAFLPAKTTTSIFGSNLFGSADLLPLYRELWGIEGFKPFECVGTPEETLAAFYLAKDQPGYQDTPIMREYLSRILPGVKNPESLIRELLTPQLDLVQNTVKDILTKAKVI